MAENNVNEVEDGFEPGLPKHLIEIVEQSKSGTIRIPKEFRDEFQEEKPKFAFWKEGDRFIFHYVKTQDLDKMNIKGAPPKKDRESSEVKEGSVLDDFLGGKIKVQPELTKYSPHDYEDRNKVSQIYEKTFYKLAESNPNLLEIIDRFKYIFMNFSNGNSTNDSKLFNSSINLIQDAILKIKNVEFIQLIEYAEEKIIPNIKSRYMLETSQIALFSGAVILNDIEVAKRILMEILNGIQKYSEIFGIIQGFKNLVHSITRQPIEIEISPIIKDEIYEEMKSFIFGSEIEVPDENENEKIIKYKKLDTDGVLRFLDLMEELGLIEKANNIVEQIILDVDEQDPLMPDLQEKRKLLSKQNIQLN